MDQPSSFTPPLHLTHTHTHTHTVISAAPHCAAWLESKMVKTAITASSYTSRISHTRLKNEASQFQVGFFHLEIHEMIYESNKKLIDLNIFFFIISISCSLLSEKTNNLFHFYQNETL